MPPCHTMTIWGNDQTYIDKYLVDVPGYYLSGDEGIIDKRGYLTILSRIDDVINVAGHRLDTGRLEESVNRHEEIVESAVVGLNDPMKGEVPIALVITRINKGEPLTYERKQHIVNEMNYAIRNEVGPWARLEGVLFMEKLPKTRSGKILRRVCKQILNDENFKQPATIDDETTLDVIKELSLANGYHDIALKPNQKWKPE
jgi:propionyl-CoA synthetase